MRLLPFLELVQPGALGATCAKLELESLLNQPIHKKSYKYVLNQGTIYILYNHMYYVNILFIFGGKIMLSTEQFAKLNNVSVQSVRNRLCSHGDFFGVKPLKKFNRRLEWPNQCIESKPLIDDSEKQLLRRIRRMIRSNPKLAAGLSIEQIAKIACVDSL